MEGNENEESIGGSIEVMDVGRKREKISEYWGREQSIGGGRGIEGLDIEKSGC